MTRMFTAMSRLIFLHWLPEALLSATPHVCPLSIMLHHWSTSALSYNATTTLRMRLHLDDLNSTWYDMAHSQSMQTSYTTTHSRGLPCNPLAPVCPALPPPGPRSQYLPPTQLRMQPGLHLGFLLPAQLMPLSRCQSNFIVNFNQSFFSKTRSKKSLIIGLKTLQNKCLEYTVVHFPHFRLTLILFL